MIDLDVLEDFHQSTTPGPWELADGGWGVYVVGASANVWARSLEASPADAEFAVNAHRVVPALVAELRAAREVVDLLRPARATVRSLLDDDAFAGTLPGSVRQRLRQVHTNLDVGVATYDQAVTP